MIRVIDPEATIFFFNLIGLTEARRIENEKGRFTLVFLTADEDCKATLALTTTDHADIYGGYTVEALFGDELRGTGLRDRIEIVTRCGIVAPVGNHATARLKHYGASRRHVTASAERSLRLLGTDRVDLLLIHRPDPFMDFNETGHTLDVLVASGKVRAVGVSNFRPWDSALLQARMHTPLA